MLQVAEWKNVFDALLSPKAIVPVRLDRMKDNTG